MVEIMFRSGVLPHMGQSPLGGSDASKARQEKTPKSLPPKMILRFIHAPLCETYAKAMASANALRSPANLFYRIPAQHLTSYAQRASWLPGYSLQPAIIPTVHKASDHHPPYSGRRIFDWAAHSVRS